MSKVLLLKGNSIKIPIVSILALTTAVWLYETGNRL